MRKRTRTLALLLAVILSFQGAAVSAEELFVSGISEAEEEAAASVESAVTEISDEGISDAEIAAEGIADTEASAGGISEAEVSAEGISDAEASAEGISDAEASEEGISGTEASEEEITDAEISDGESSADVFTDAEESETEEEIVLDPEEYSTDAGSVVDETIFEEYGISLFSDDEESVAFSNSYAAGLEIYSGSYGVQLEDFNGNDYAVQCYNLFVEKLTTDWSSAAGQSFSLTLETPIQFEGEVTETSSGSLQIVKNDSYYTEYKPLKEAVCAAWSAFLYDYPEAFWMHSVAYAPGMTAKRDSDDSTSAVITIKLLKFTPDTVYDDTQTVIDTFQANVETAVEELEAQTEGGSRYEIVKAIHDYVCEKAYYDSSGLITSGTGTAAQYRTHCAGPIFVDDGGVVCEGYAKAVKILCDRMGISCACVVGKASTTGGTGEAHMWNYIQMENESWYLTDTTWDDSSTIREIYLLVGSNSDGKNIKISQERTNSATFYTLSGDDNISEYTVMSFVYPELSVNSYLDDTESDSTTTTAEETTTEETTASATETATEAPTSEETTASATETATEAATAEETTASATETPTEETTASAVETPTEETTASAEKTTASATKEATSEETTASVEKTTASVTEATSEKTTASVTEGTTEATTAEEMTAGAAESQAGSTASKETTEAAATETTTETTTEAMTETTTGTPATAAAESLTDALDDTPEETVAEATDDTEEKASTPTMTLSASSFSLRVKQSYTVKVSGLAAGDSVKSWKSNKPKVASVNKNGKITGKKAGTAKITVTLKSGLSRTITVKVQKSAVKTTKLTVNSRKIILKRGRTFRLTATVTPVTSKEKVTYRSSNKKVATVNSSGKITAKKKGTAVITVQSGKKKVKVRVTVK